MRSSSTRRDVARLAGTSTAVVSYVINNGPRPVAHATRQRVMAAIEALGYRPNWIAQALSARRTGALGLVLPDSSNPHFARLAREVERIVTARGQMLLFANTEQNPVSELRHIEAFLDRKVDGIFLIGATNSARSSEVLADSGTPYILLDRLSRDPRARVVRTDNEKGGALATGHLIALGHRRIAHLSGPWQLAGVRERTAGYRRAMREARLPALPVIISAFDLARAYDAARDLLAAPGRPDALFVGSDVQAIGVLRAAADCGLAVPGDLAVVGFDGIPESAYSVPRLTTIVQPVAAIAACAAEMLFADIDGGRSGDVNLSPRVQTLPPELVIRESCGARGTA
jgi:LacI family transcriptional regulator